MTLHMWGILLHKGLSIFREVKKAVHLWDYARGEWEVL